MWLNAGGAHLLGHVPPPGTTLHRECHRVDPVETVQPIGEMFPVRRSDPAALAAPGLLLDVVERQLLPMNVQPAYDRHRDLLNLRSA
jgi:hypothetical protein